MGFGFSNRHDQTWNCSIRPTSPVLNCSNTVLSIFFKINSTLIKRIRYGLLLVILLLTVSMPVQADPIKIAAIFSQTGIAAAHNEPLIKMVQLAVEDINRSGGILNQPVQLILLDNQSTPIGASVAANEAIRMDVTAVIGAHWSSHSLAMAPILQKAGIPMISPGSTNPEVTRIGNFIFRACFLDSFQGKAMARFAREHLKSSSAVVIKNIDEEYSVMLAHFFATSFTQLGGKILLESQYRGKAVDFAPEIQQILKHRTDVIYIPGYTRDSGLFIKQARSMGIKAIFLGGDAWDEIGSVAEDSINGSYQSAPWHPDSPSARSRFLKELYKLKFHKPLTHVSAPLAFDAVHILASAIEKARTRDRHKIRQSLAAIQNFQGVTGIISFDSYGDPIDKDVIIVRFNNKKPEYYQTIKPGL